MKRLLWLFVSFIWCVSGCSRARAAAPRCSIKTSYGRKDAGEVQGYLGTDQLELHHGRGNALEFARFQFSREGRRL
jgi:hypothetical protein